MESKPVLPSQVNSTESQASYSLKLTISTKTESKRSSTYEIEHYQPNFIIELRSNENQNKVKQVSTDACFKRS